MVQVFDLSPTPSSASMIGNALGKGMAKNFVPPQQMVQRKMLQEGLDKVGNLAKDPNAKPIDLMTQYLHTFAGIPGAEKFAAPMLDKLMSMAAYNQDLTAQGEQSNNVPGAPPLGNPPPTMQGGVTAQQSIPVMDSPITSMELGQYVPLDLGAYIDPAQTKSIVESVGKKGGDVNLVKERINDYNRGLIDYNQLVNTNVDRKAAQQARQLTLEKQGREFLDKQLSPNISEDRKSLYYEMLKKELAKSPDISTAYNKIQGPIQAIEKQLKEIPNKIPKVSSFDKWGINDSQENILRSATKNIMDIDPLAYPIIEKMFSDQGHPITQTAKVLKPLPEDVSKITEKAPDYRSVLYPTLSGFWKSFREPSEKEMLNNIDIAQKQQSNAAPKLAKDLSKKINEDTSFINIYTDLKVKGWFPEQIYEVFGELSNLVDLSPQQQTEITQLASPPPIPVRYIK